MKSQKLLELIGGIDEDLIASVSSAESGGHSPRLRWAAAAAALVLALCAGVIMLARHNQIKDTPVTPAVSGSSVISSTSDKYESLDQLLEYLSRHDNHSADSLKESSSAGSRGADTVGYLDSSSAVIINGYSCHIGTDGVVISRLEAGSASPVRTIPCANGRLLSHGDKLIIVSEIDTVLENDFDYQLDLHVSVYDMSDPSDPKLTCAISQSGSFCGAFISDGILWMLSSDGECACGYSRLEDKSEYVPEITIDGQSVTLSDEQLHVLGEPSMVRYLAVTGICLEDMSVSDAQVMYGDIDAVHYGSDYVALELMTMSGSKRTQPEVYLFSIGRTVGYSGKISTAAALGIPQSTRPNFPGAQSFELTSFTRHAGQYRLTGVLHTSGSEKGSSRIAYIYASDALDVCRAVLSDSFDGHVTITEVLNEDARQIICYSTIDEDYSQSGHFAFALCADEPSIATPASDIDHMDGIDMIYASGSPYGEFATLIPLGDGVYLRYEGKPNRVSAYDLSDPQSPALLEQNCIALEDIQRFCYETHIYSDGRIGAIVLTPSLDDEGEYNYRSKYLTREYVIFAPDEDTLTYSPVFRRVLSEYSELCVLEWDGYYYCFTAQSEAPVPVE